MIDSNKLEEVYKSMQRPAGHLTSRSNVKELFNKKIPKIIFQDIVAGAHHFLVERDENLHLTFYHSCPGIGTREATIDLKKIKPCEIAIVTLSWSPEEIQFQFYSQGEKLSEKGKKSKKHYSVGSDGKVHKISEDREVSTMAHLTIDGKVVVQPTAIDVWNETLQALDKLVAVRLHEDGLEYIVSNLSLSMLVSGFEAYTKRRFIEIEEEGIAPRTDKLIKAIYTMKERAPNIVQVIKEEAEEESKSIIRYVVDKGKINFQHYKQCRIAYSKAYQIQFGNMGIPNSLLDELQKYIKYRHKVIHVHPAFGLLNPEKSGIEPPVYSNYQLVEKAKNTFSEFIENLHKATLDWEKYK